MLCAPPTMLNSRRLLAFSLLLAARSPGAAPVDFNRDVRPIIAEKCYHCHGPDDEARKAKLRLDVREDALKEHEGTRAIVPGRPEQSELLTRILSKDPDEIMPPPKEHHTVTPAEIDTLKRWIAEGATYAKHWAFVPVATSAKGNSIDDFIRAELKAHALALSPEAEKATLIRRLSLDLIGLPPTPDETRLFVEDTAPDAYARAVDRLLASPHFGERWARMWLDLARYADSSGYGSDFVRLNIWPWRDWVIGAFNANKPFDQFTIEQIAGDLLPNPTREQLVATAFHRNTMTNFEGGTPDEEYRVAAVKDRVATTMQVWMGLTAGCAQCHSHKFDPLSIREYYSLFAVFNQTEDADRNDEEPKMPLPSTDEEKRTTELKARIADLEKKLANTTPELETEFNAWLTQPARAIDWQPLTVETAKTRSGQLAAQPDGSVLAPAEVEDTETYTITAKTSLRKITAIRLEVLPEAEGKAVGRAGGNAVLSEFKATARPVQANAARARYVRIEHDANKLLQIAEVQVFSGGQNIAPKGKATQSSTFDAAVASRAIDGNTEGTYDKNSVAHTGNGDPKPWWEVDFGAPVEIERVVFWNRTEVGERIKGARLIVLDADRKPLLSRVIDNVPKPSRTFDALGTIDATFAAATADFSQDGWSSDKAIDGDVKTGWGFAPETTKAHVGVFELKTPIDVGGDPLITATLTQNYGGGHVLSRVRLSATTSAAPVRETPTKIRDLLALKERTPQQRDELLKYYRPLSKAFATTTKDLAAAKAQLAAIKPLDLPIMRELPKEKQRESRMLTKGNYLMPGDVVTAALPSAFNPPPTGTPDRLALAKWLVSRDNPLTARVTVNRFWAQLFGSGLVESEEDFGTQGSLPSHPELLDWLAIEFMRDWDMKRVIKLIVSSATYRQSSKITPELLAKDPRDRLLSRYPRRRLGAEEIRDQALAVSGLLSHKIGGASVYPPQPDGLWNVAFNGGQNQYKTSTGEDRYRRGLYTFWRRTMPNPTMLAFDAPSRETCTLRRVPTNTPLQAFVTLNDPVFVECAQALARRIQREGGADPDSRIRYGLELVLGHAADAKQIAALRKLLDDELANYKQKPDDALTLATKPLGPLPAGADPVEAAAWTTVTNVLLNLDAILTRS